MVGADIGANALLLLSFLVLLLLLLLLLPPPLYELLTLLLDPELFPREKMLFFFDDFLPLSLSLV